MAIRPTQGSGGGGWFTNRGPIEGTEVRDAFRAQTRGAGARDLLAGSVQWRDGARNPFEFTARIATPTGPISTRGTYDDSTGRVTFDVLGAVERRPSPSPMGLVTPPAARSPAAPPQNPRLFDAVRAAVLQRHADPDSPCQLWLEPGSLRTTEEPGKPPTFTLSATDLREPNGSAQRLVRLQGAYDPETFTVWLAKTASRPRPVEEPPSGGATPRIVSLAEARAKRAKSGDPS
jgi:hypothetical protein